MSSLDLIIFAVAILAAGGFAGLIAGLFGVGGGVITVPILFTIFKMAGVAPDIAIHTAVGTSLLTIIPTSIASFRTHARHKAVDVKILKEWGPAVVIGAAAGALIANRLSGPALSLVFGVFAIAIAAFMGLAPRDLVLAKRPPRGFLRHFLAGPIGLVSALVGVGGGSLSVPAMVMLNMPIRRAIGTAAAIGFLISLPGTLVFMLAPVPAAGLPPGSFGHVNGLAFALLAPVAMLTAPLGARLAHRLPVAKLRHGFSIFLLLIAAKMIAAALA